MMSSLSWICIVFPYIIKALIIPTISNTSGEYYITSQSGSFANNIITCTSTSCFITCDNPQNCSSTIINASQSDSLTIQCTEYRSCYLINLLQGPSTSIHIQCLNAAACDQAVFDIQDTEDVYISCYNINCDGCGTSKGACRLAIFNAQHSINVNVDCLHRYDCWSTTFDITNTDNTYLYASKYGGLWKSIIIGTSISDELTVNCTGKSACRQADITCPISASCNIYCQYDAIDWEICRDLDIFLENVNAELNLICGSKSGNCQNVDLHCDSTGLMSNIEWFGEPDRYECIDLDLCCPNTLRAPVNIIHCNSGANCVLNCTDISCAYKTIINATYALSLTVSCNNNYECQYNDIYCPNNGDCIVNCLGQSSCRFMELFPETVTSLRINCVGSYSCKNMDIRDYIVIGNTDVICFGVQSCYLMDIIVETTGDYFKLYCTDGKQDCRHMDVRVNGDRYKTDVIITANAELALYRADLEIYNVRSFTIYCAASIDNDFSTCLDLDTTTSNINEINILCKHWKACYSNKWVLNANDIIFKCHGDLACSESIMDINVSNSISITTTNETAMLDTATNIFCWDCMNTFNCLNNITINCGLNINPVPINTGDQCRNCMCDMQQSNAVYTIPFINNIWQQCIPTLQPTVDPTIIPTFMPTFIPTQSPTNIPTYIPTINPSTVPTFYPTQYPTIEPTFIPTLTPTIDPTNNPTIYPTNDPTPNEAGIDEISSTIGYIQQTNEHDLMSNKNGSNEYMFIILISIIIFILLLVIIVSVFVIYRKKHKKYEIEKQKKMMNTDDINMSEMTTTNAHNVKLNDNMNDTDNITKGGPDHITTAIMNSMHSNDEFIIHGEDEITAGNIIENNSESTGEEDISDDNTQEITSGNIDDDIMLMSMSTPSDFTVQ